MIQKNQQRIAEASRPLTPVVMVARHVASPAADLLDSHSVALDPETTVGLSRPDRRTAEEVSREAAERSIAAEQADREREARMENVRKRGNVYLPEDGDLLINQGKGSLVKIQGKLAKVHTTDTGTVFLSFSRKFQKDELRAYVDKDDATRELTEASLGHLVGHTIQMEGTLRISGSRPEVGIKARSAITEP